MSDEPTDQAPQFGVTPWGDTMPRDPGALTIVDLVRVLEASGVTVPDDIAAIVPRAVPAIGLIPDVIAGDLIESAWGNEIRNRTITPFPDIASLKAWAAPDGRHAWVTATNQLYWRRGGAWWTRSTYYGASVTLTATGTYPIAAGGGFNLASMAGGWATIVWDAANPAVVGWSTFRLTGGTVGAWTSIDVRGWTTNAAGTSTVPAANAATRQVQAEAWGPIA